MAKHWNYAQSNQRVGLMICTACHKPLSEGDGDFRYRETDDAYLPQHRTCSADDPVWAQVDKRRAEHAAFFQRRKAALSKFVAEFGAPDDELIDQVMAERSDRDTENSQGK